jgi:hypothetical protein
MEEQKSVEQSKTNIKEVFYSQLNKAACDLIKNVVNAKSLGIAIIIWFVISVATSIYRRVDTVIMPDGSIKSRCEVTVPLDTYFMAKMICPIN